MAFDSPKIGGYVFKIPPKPIEVYWEPQLTKNQLADGHTVVYNKGFILKGELQWGRDGWCDNDDYSNIAVLYNQFTATALFYPRPDTYPTRYFRVQITNDFNFVPHDSLLNIGRQLYEGSIVFEGSIGEITATASVIF